MGPPTLGCPQPMGPPTHGGPQPMGAANPWGPYPWGFPSFVGTSPLGSLNGEPWGPPTFGPQSLGGPRALGAPRPGLVGLVGNPPLVVSTGDHRLVGYRIPTEGTLTEEQRAVVLIAGFKRSSKGDFLVQYGAFQCGVVGCWVCGC
jgi:hypothetical protein